MSDELTEVQRLERELLAAHEMLYLVLDAIGEPVQVEAETMQSKMDKDGRMIDATLDADGVYWTFQIKQVANDELV